MQGIQNAKLRLFQRLNSGKPVRPNSGFLDRLPYRPICLKITLLLEFPICISDPEKHPSQSKSEVEEEGCARPSDKQGLRS